MPLIDRVRVSVEDDAAFDLSGRFDRAHYVAGRALFEQKVDRLFVEHELADHGQQPQHEKHDADDGREKQRDDCNQRAGRGDVGPAEERVRRDFVGFAVRLVRKLVELASHIVESLVFALGTGVAVAELFDDVLDLVTDELHAFFALLLRNVHIFPPYGC